MKSDWIDCLESRWMLAALATFRMVVDGGDFNNASELVVHSGDTVNFKILGKVAAVGTHNSSGAGRTISSLTKSPIDGLNQVRFNIQSNPGDPIQIDFASEATLGAGFNKGFSSQGSVEVRSGTSFHDLNGVKAVRDIQSYLGVSQDNTPNEIVLATGSFTVQITGAGLTSDVRMGYLSPNQAPGLMRINNGVSVIPNASDIDPIYSFTGLRLRSSAVGTPESNPPAGTLMTSGGPTAGSGSFSIPVLYTDQTGVAAGSISADDLLITGPAGNSLTPSSFTLSGDDPKSLTATYRLDAPGGAWDSLDNGTYTVFLRGAQVSDTLNNIAPAGNLGTFTVDLPFAALASKGRLLVNGTGGADTISLGISSGNLNVTRGSQTLSFTATSVKSIRVMGLGGNDRITIGAGVIGATVDGGSGNDLLNGGGGNDSLIGGPGADVFNGGAGVDLADYSSATAGVSVSLDGRANDGSGKEHDNVKGDVENVKGGRGSDVIVGSAGNNELHGGAGNDTITGRRGADRLFGDGGSDSLFSRDRIKDTVSGGAGKDQGKLDVLDVRDTLEKLLR